MSIQIRVSYQTPEDLQLVLHLLGDKVRKYKVSRNQEGKYRKAYITLVK